MRWQNDTVQTDLTGLLEGRFLLLIASLSSHRNVSEGALESLAVSLPAEQSTASLSYLSSETYWLKWERLGGLDSPRRTPREKSRRWQFWRSPDQSLIWDCHWYSTGRSWYKRISGKPLSRNLQTIPVKINHRLLLWIFYILENDKSARTKCFLDLTLDIWSKKNSPTRKPRNRQPNLIKTKTLTRAHQ